MFVTPLNSPQGHRRDAAVAWAEDVSKEGFRVCLRELKNFNGAHRKVRVVRDGREGEKGREGGREGERERGRERGR